MATKSKKSIRKSTSGPHWSSWFWLLLFGMFLAGGWMILVDSERFPLNQVQIDGEYPHLSPTKIKQMMAPYIAQGFFGLQAYSLRSELLEQPWLAQVSVRRIWPDGVRVELHEHVPVARWGRDAILSEQGVLFFPPLDEKLLAMPMLLGPENQREHMFLSFKNMQAALQALHLSVVQLEQSDRAAWRAQLSNSTILELGREDIDRRFARYLLAYQKTLQSQAKQPVYVDLRYADGMAVKYINQ